MRSWCPGRLLVFVDPIIFGNILELIGVVVVAGFLSTDGFERSETVCQSGVGRVLGLVGRLLVEHC